VGPSRTAAPATLALAVALACSSLAAAAEVPYLAGRVNDTAGMVPADVAARLEERLRALEERTGAQVAVLTVDSLEGDSIEEFAMRVAETWKLGQKGKDNGVLFVVAKGDRAMRIEVGYGLEGVLTDALAKRILDGIARPRFRAGDFGGGIEATVEAIAATIEGDTSAVPAEAESRSLTDQNVPLPVRILGMLIFAVVIGVFSMVALFGSGCQSWFLYVFLMPFYFTFPLVFLGVFGLVLPVLWVVGFPLAKLLLSRTPAGKRFRDAHPGLVAFATSSGGGSHGWSSSGSSFSGGGGSFGGGGASSSW